MNRIPDSDLQLGHDTPLLVAYKTNLHRARMFALRRVSHLAVLARSANQWGTSSRSFSVIS